MMLSPYHPLQLALGLAIWIAWFALLFGVLAIACEMSPPAEHGPFTWINVALLFSTLSISGLLSYGAYVSRYAARVKDTKRSRSRLIIAAARRHLSDGGQRNAQYGVDASMSLKRAVWALIMLPAGPAQAHGVIDDAGAALPEMLGGLLLVLLWLSYCVGACRVQPAAGRSWLFHIASLIAALMTFAPLEGWMENGAALHMIRHTLILAVITPLFILARPLPQWFAASGAISVYLCKPLLRLGRYPIWTSILQGIAIWLWHAPKFYNLALASPWWHLVEHASFALTAGMFWWSVLCRRASSALPALLFTLMHTGMLGALLSFAQTPVYADLRDIQDQQLAGLIMWLPGSLPYLAAGIWCSLRAFQISACTNRTEK